MILAITSHKGGVGKTTTAVNLAAEFGAAGQRVLLVDLDSQASASHHLGISKADLHPGVADVLWTRRQSPGAAIRVDVAPGVDLLPGSPEMAQFDLRAANQKNRELIISDLLAGFDYPLIILDTPPTFSLLQLAAIRAADRLLVPTEPSYLALEGLVGFLDLVEVADVLGVLITRADYRNRAAIEVADAIREAFGGLVLKTEIRVATDLAEASSHGRPVREVYPRGSRGGDFYRALAREIGGRLRR